MRNHASSASEIEMSGKGEPQVLHASCVSYQNSAVIMIGPSGSGKSALALQLMAMGAKLVSDDKTHVQIRDRNIIATAPPAIKGLIEARNVGILKADTCDAAAVRLIVDLEQVEHDRLPQHRKYNLLGQMLPVLHNVKAAYFAAAILQYLKEGRSA